MIARSVLPCVFVVMTILALQQAVAAFAPQGPAVASTSASSSRTFVSKKLPQQQVNMAFGFDEEAKTLTRETEPSDYFATNTDKMSDQEKIPIAIAGIAAISLPFILGLIALYTYK